MLACFWLYALRMSSTYLKYPSVWCVSSISSTLVFSLLCRYISENRENLGLPRRDLFVCMFCLRSWSNFERWWAVIMWLILFYVQGLCCVDCIDFDGHDQGLIGMLKYISVTSNDANFKSEYTWISFRSSMKCAVFFIILIIQCTWTLSLLMSYI
jgi:hypothetical protein